MLFIISILAVHLGELVAGRHLQMSSSSSTSSSMGFDPGKSYRMFVVGSAWWAQDIYLHLP
jgi:hypothetical protein